jgi:hypothetical protein
MGYKISGLHNMMVNILIFLDGSSEEHFVSIFMAEVNFFLTWRWKQYVRLHLRLQLQNNCSAISQ